MAAMCCSHCSVACEKAEAQKAEDLAMKLMSLHIAQGHITRGRGHPGDCEEAVTVGRQHALCWCTRPLTLPFCGSLSQVIILLLLLLQGPCSRTDRNLPFGAL